MSVCSFSAFAESLALVLSLWVRKNVYFIFAKLVQIESNTKRACSFLLPRCSLTSAKLVEKNERHKQNAGNDINQDVF